MAAEWVEIGKEVVKLAVRARYSFSIWVVSLFILVIPLPTFLGLDSFRHKHGEYVGLVCLSMFVVWVVEVSLIWFESIKNDRRLRDAEKRILQQLDSLNPREAHLLVFAASKKIQTVAWREDADEVSSLAAKGLLSVVPDGSKMLHKPYTIPRFVWEAINQGRALTKLTELDKHNKD